MFNDFDPFLGIKLCKCKCGGKAVGAYTFGSPKPFRIQCDECHRSTKQFKVRNEALLSWKKINRKEL